MNLKSLIRVGEVSSVNPLACTVRVAFGDQDNLVSPELPVLVRGSMNTKDYWLPEPGEQVWCLFLPTGNIGDGIVLGATYSEQDKPPVNDPRKRHISFPDGTVIEYDQTTSTLKVDGAKKINLVVSERVKVTVPTLYVDGSIKASGTILGNEPIPSD